MAKFCSNGHQMEDSWEICPYCQRTFLPDESPELDERWFGHG